MLASALPRNETVNEIRQPLTPARRRLKQVEHERQPPVALQSTARLYLGSVRDDFYSDLVSSQNNNMLFAVRRIVYMWNDQENDFTLEFNTQVMVSCLLLAGKRDIAFIGCENGMIIIYNLVHDIVEARFTLPATGIKAHPTRFAWDPERKSPRKNRGILYCGDSIGRVHRFAVNLDADKRVQCTWSSKEHTDLITGLVINKTGTLIAVASSDTFVSIWNLEDTNPRLSAVVAHKSAVRALEFCPWAPQVLVTGSGRNDRMLRVISFEGPYRVVHALRVHGQVTAVLWLDRWRILVCYGHGRPHKSKILAQVVAMPDKRIVAEVVGEGRVLTAVHKEHGFALCTSAQLCWSYNWTSSTQYCSVDDFLRDRGPSTALKPVVR